MIALGSCLTPHPQRTRNALAYAHSPLIQERTKQLSRGQFPRTLQDDYTPLNGTEYLYAYTKDYNMKKDKNLLIIIRH